MKKMKYLLFCLLLTGLFSCKKDESAPVENKGLIGKWKLAEFISDPGTGKPVYVKANEASSSLIEFKANGDFSEVKGVIYSSINPYDTYQELADKRLKLTIKKPSSTPIEAMWTYSDLTPTTLTLSYGCFEMCSGKYVAVR
jgi:hypothetical protein